MAQGGFILFIGAGDEPAWRVAPVVGDGPAMTVEPSPESIRSALGRLGYRGEGVVLAIPSSWCMAVTIDLVQMGARDNRSMTYRLEEHLPLAAESVVADFIVGDGKALGVCARLEAVGDAIAALESQGITVRSVAPAVLLAALQVARASKDDVILRLAEGSHVNLIALRNGLATSWVMADPRDMALHLDVMSLESDALLPLRELSPDGVEQAARGQARRVLEGREVAWGEMRRGPLAGADRLRGHRKALNAALAAAAVLLLACSGAMLWRAHQYDRAARENEAALASEFGRAFPGWAVPANVKTVIESERRKALALAEDAPGGARSGSATRTLHNVLTQLPTDERWTIQRMMFEDDLFEIEGKLRAADALDRFAAAVRRTGMTVAPPESQKAADGLWSFTLRGTRRPGMALGRTDQN
jgi:hypothetical protein